MAAYLIQNNLIPPVPFFIYFIYLAQYFEGQKSGRPGEKEMRLEKNCICSTLKGDVGSNKSFILVV